MAQPRLDQIPQNATRVVYEFPIPKKLANEHVTESVGLIKLTAEEEQKATKLSRGDSGRLAFELVKQAFHSVDGKPLDRNNAEEETAFNKMEPKLRQLLMAAYAHLHSPEDDETENFLAAMTEKVG